MNRPDLQLLPERQTADSAPPASLQAGEEDPFPDPKLLMALGGA